MDAREALKEAHRAVEKLIAPSDPNQENPLMVPEMRRVFTRLLVQVSNDDPADQIRSWEDVRATVPLCVALVPELEPKATQVTRLYLDVVNHAEKLAPTYVSPPPFV